MIQYPTLHIENFARIRQADIELAPLTLFVGDNNSGKTYLATLIWGLNDLLFRFQKYAPTKTEALPPALQTLQKQIEDNTHQPKYSEKFEITQELHNEIQDLLNKTLGNSGITGKWIHDLFCSRSISIGKVSLSLPYQKNYCFHVKKYEKITHNETRTCYRYGVEQDKESRLSDLTPLPDVSLLTHLSDGNLSADTMVRKLIRSYVSSYWISLTQQSFFPDSRNGILLTYPSIVKESIETRFGSNYTFKDAYQLTAPQREFLKQLVDYPKWRVANQQNSDRFENSEFGKFVKFIESEMIRGQIILDPEGLVEFFYKPQHLDQSIPMNLSSGVVTSLAPLLAALKYDSVGYRCFIEEPEMSLHPALEWRMAQVLIRLANTVDFVLATTHSTTIIQHVNNMIKLANRSSDGETLAKEHDYTSDDIISPEKVRMYQFDVIENEALTEVRLLECTKNGFRIPTYGKTLSKLQDETWDFHVEKEEPAK